MIEFESPKNQSSIIKVIGVGGGGGNAVDYMYNLDIEGVDFIVCNTDSQALERSPVPNKIQLGPHLTQGLGAGANPEVGRQAGEESVEDIAEMLQVKTKMAFITAGMGGGTGTGAAPIIAKVCKEMNILTVGIVTTPFSYEGRKRLQQAQEGIAALREYVDTILIISNDKLRQQFGNLAFSEAFAKADNILATAAKCITDLITVDGRVNLDFNDVQTVMRDGGVAILGSAQAEGDGRAKNAVVDALNSPLLNDDDIEGAKWILLNINSAPGEYEHTLDELDTIQGYVQEKAGNNSNIILGMGADPSLGEKIAVTIIATGFKQNEIKSEMPAAKEAKSPKVLIDLNESNPEKLDATSKEADAKIKDTKDDQMTPHLLLNDDHEDSSDELHQVTSSKPATHYQLELPEDQKVGAVNEEGKEYAKKEASKQAEVEDLKLIIKDNRNSDKMPAEPKPEVARNDTRSEIEKEKERQYEEEKKSFEERAERLRRMTFGGVEKEDQDELERVPAYRRRGTNLEEPKEDDYMSDYFVEEKGEGNHKRASIRTLNTFLRGKKPD